MELELKSQLLKHADCKVFSPPGRCYDPVGHSLFQFGLSCPCLLRDREVLFKSGGAAYCHGAADPDQLAGFGIQHFFKVIIEDFIADLHGTPLW